MRNNIVHISEIDKYKSLLGNKTINLKKCIDWGFNVPKFIAIPSNVSNDLLSSADLRKIIVENTISSLNSRKYAVRSSALIEDGLYNSFAGQFLTLTNVDKEGLESSICKVLNQAKKYLNGELNNFSIIIQEYVVPDVFGVTFTRNPNGNREMLMEYGFCEGEKIVSGQVSPKKKLFYWNQPQNNFPKFITNEIVDKFKNLEKKYNFPQDIEWCLKDNKFYVLQTRNITTISEDQYQNINFLEESLKEEHYYFEKTEISEIAPKPCKITIDLLNKIYEQNGPVSNVYEKYKVSYCNTKFLKIIGNQLYVDKECEIKSLLPAYTYFSNSKFIPKFGSFVGVIDTLKNIFHLNTIRTNSYNKLFENLKNAIESRKEPISYQDSITLFLKEYEIIFEINLLSGLSIKKLNIFLKNELISFSEIIEHQSFFVDLQTYSLVKPNNLKGNSIDIQDESDFYVNSHSQPQKSNKIEKWWKSLSKYKKNLLHKTIEEAIIYNHLRELGRLLAVKNINIIRDNLLNYAKNKGFKYSENIYFSPLKNVANEDLCLKNKQDYNSFNQFGLPTKITSAFQVKDKKKIIGISSGIANGILKTKEMIDEDETDKPIILYTEILSPDLTIYFDKIVGIVSKNGGILSHLAIIAREQQIPVIVGLSLESSDYLGKDVNINGTTGEIELSLKE